MPAAILARSKAFELFVDAAPGMGELLTIGKVWELAQRPRHRRGAPEYDLVVLDAPASGQLVGLLAAPQTFGAIARVGPVARQAAAIDRMVRDPDLVGVIAVATPEQMAVSETLSLSAALNNEFGIELGAVLLNRMFHPRFSANDSLALAALPDDPAVRSARWLQGRAGTQRAQLARLRRQLAGVSCTRLPFLFTADLGRSDVERLADLLERTLA